MNRVLKSLLALGIALAASCAPAWALAQGAGSPDSSAGDAPDSSAGDAPDSSATFEKAPSWDAPVRRPLEALVPDLAQHPYRMSPGRRPYEHRLSVSPAYGFFGSDRLFALRLTFNPNPWLGYEAAVSHDPAHAAHALLHTLTAIVRRPLTGRLQPYLAGGYGMVVVFPGEAVNAAPVTKNTLTAGGGLELYLRNDLALRADLRQAMVFGQQKGHEGVVTYDYLQGTIGLAFYRSIRP